ncbi:SdpA family antimicrobial peptide system protein [Actinosynnema sp. NPDC020468]|uniref:SdpA family antimicrobial peptide system protein n=1 Tax=Actinosynnema sp. NPDC020468 TaxID=3154488 RepID=UPI0033F29C5D
MAVGAPPLEGRSKEDVRDDGQARRRDSANRLRARALFLIAIVLALFGTLLYVLDAALPESSMGLPGQDKQAVRGVLPEGWAFFTRSPREDQLISWRTTGSEGWNRANSVRSWSPESLFGASRAPRALDMEMGRLLGDASRQKAVFADCAADESAETLRDVVNSCLDEVPVAAKVVNVASPPHLCGRVAVSKQPPMPWTWAKGGVEEQMPVQVMSLEVRC